MGLEGRPGRGRCKPVYSVTELTYRFWTMTLIVALILMNHVGGFNAVEYGIVVMAWLVHLGFHYVDERALARKIRDAMW